MTSYMHVAPLPYDVDPVEAELTKDIWDVRNIPGARYAAHKSDMRVSTIESRRY
jgi:hypothetical protein